MLQDVRLQCSLADIRVTLFTDFEWWQPSTRSILEICFCLEGRTGKCQHVSCRFHKQGSPDGGHPFSEEFLEQKFSSRRPKDAKRPPFLPQRSKAVNRPHVPPERIRHFFEAFGIESSPTPERVNLLKTGGGFVYIILCNDLVKIGIAQNVEMRLAYLQVGNPYAIKLIKAFPSVTPAEDEMKLHARFRKFHVRGEWFKLPPRLIQGLKRIRDLSGIDFASSRNRKPRINKE